MQADGLVIDLFAGGGGASAGIAAALGREPDVAINHDAVALAVHRANHPGTLHLDADVWEVRPREATKGRPVGLLWASPDHRAVMAMALLAAAGVDVEGAMRAARQAEAPPPPEPATLAALAKCAAELGLTEGGRRAG